MRLSQIFIFAVLFLFCSGGALALTDNVKVAKTKISFTDDSITKSEPVFIEANNIDYNTNTKEVAASGRVEILKGETVLFADNVKYDQTNNLVYATGNVVVTGKDNNTIFTDSFVLRGDFKEGVIKYFRAKLSDGSLIASASARRVDDKKTELKKAVYSPCKICIGSNDDPLWQLKAEDVIIDETTQTVTYNDAYMEVYGTPVMYTPYFQHPTPNADAKSGFLTPSINTDGNLGAAIKTPYYWSIYPNMDATLEPVTTTKEGLVAASQLRHKMSYGEYELYGSITRPRGFTELADSGTDSQKSVRGHLKGIGIFDLSEHWKTGFNAEYASDDTYLRRYNYGNEDLLTSRAYFERIEDRNYTNLQTVHFQGLLETDNSDTIPLALPYTRNYYETSKGIIPAFDGSYAFGDVNGFAVSRDVGEESKRISINSGINIPFITSGGNIFESQFSLRGDAFDIKNTNGTTTDKQRLIPEASIGWRYPLTNNLGKGRSIYLEPIAKIITSPNKDYNKDIPNEDSQDVEYSDLNVFSNNRFRGIDRVESGNRMQYGINAGYYDDGLSVTGLLGQSYNFNKTTNLPANTGLESKLADYVGRVSVNIYNTLDVAYRFRVDSSSHKFRRNELDANLDMHPVKFSLSYFYLDYDFTNTTDNREEVTGSATYNVDDNWRVVAGGRRNLAQNSNVDASMGVGYENECLNTLVSVKREFLSDRDAKGGVSFNFQIGLKNLGEI